ncbi:MAG: hypothetical protein IKX60_04800 [Bacteroidales bacterium]|nr:hypothetical protein [Bacteroidales bacterium]
MKRILTLSLIFIAAAMATSCGKDLFTPDGYLLDKSLVAKTTIQQKGAIQSGQEDFKTTIVDFGDGTVQRTSEKEGQSLLMAHSTGITVYDAFWLSAYFDCIDNMKVGDVLKPSYCWFSLILSSSSNTWAFSYAGKITLAAKGDDYVVFNFDKVTFTTDVYKYVMDGYLRCELN